MCYEMFSTEKYFIIFGFLGDAKMATINIFFIKVYTVSKAERKVELHWTLYFGLKKLSSGEEKKENTTEKFNTEQNKNKQQNKPRTGKVTKIVYLRDRL